VSMAALILPWEMSELTL